MNQKALRLAEPGVETLVCGAITSPMHAVVSAYGIRVIPFVSGDLLRVIHGDDIDGYYLSIYLEDEVPW